MAQKQLNGEEKKLFSVPRQLNSIHTLIFSRYLESKPFYGQKESNSFLISFQLHQKGRSQF